ncbi:MAG: energy transducer TonB [Muribaculaceae bacterium]|nr:energy transducer TonB [Muribaculaceae bacterium]
MARGKQTCKILKDIRRQIAEANDIEFITSECQFQGDCLGTCPKCEAELRYLDNQLTLRRMAGKAIVVAGLSAGMLTLASCSNQKQDADNYNPEYDEEYNVDVHENDDDDFFEGEIEGELLPDWDQQDSLNNQSTLPIDKDRVYSISEVDSIPVFPGGSEAMYKWISNHINYPSVAAEEGIQGKVIVEVMVSKTGTVENARVLRGRHPALDNEALRVVNSMPKWSPGHYKDNVVNVTYVLPVTFRLQQ